jgi:hypothetical protein
VGEREPVAALPADLPIRAPSRINLIQRLQAAF